MSKTFCPLPWNHLATHPTGHVTLCCNSNHAKLNDASRNFKDGTSKFMMLADHSINDILNSDYYKSVRLKFLNNEYPEECKGCFDKESVGNTSKRTDSLNEFDFNFENARTITKSDGSIEIPLEFIELRLGNLCNMRCVTCNPASSNRWIPEYQQLEKELKFVTKFNINSIQTSWSDSSKFWKDLENYSSKIKKVYINGGEPLLNKTHLEFLSKLSSDTVIVYNTNLSVINSKILNVWKKFKEVHLNVSIDDLRSRNDYIRFESKWEILINNLKTLEKFSFIKISITQTVSFFNIFYIDEFKEYFKDYQSHFNFVSEPDFLDIKLLPNQLVEKIRQKYQTQEYFSEINNYLDIGKKFSEDTKQEKIQDALKYINWLDTSRLTCFNQTFTSWSNLIYEELKI